MRPTGALRLAHRGDWRVAPENSMASLMAALANPACDGLEFDVRGSRDGVPILLHDETLDRVQGRPERPEDLTTEDLEALGIPALDAVLAAAGPGPFLDVELKGAILPAVVSVLERHRGAFLERTIVSSFEPETLRWLSHERPAWRRWLNAEQLTPDDVATALDLGCSAISVAWPSVTPMAFRMAVNAGLEVASWTVRRRPTFERLDRLGVVAVCVEAAALDG